MSDIFPSNVGGYKMLLELWRIWGFLPGTNRLFQTFPVEEEYGKVPMAPVGSNS